MPQDGAEADIGRWGCPNADSYSALTSLKSHLLNCKPLEDRGMVITAEDLAMHEGMEACFRAEVHDWSLSLLAGSGDVLNSNKKRRGPSTTAIFPYSQRQRENEKLERKIPVRRIKPSEGDISSKQSAWFFDISLRLRKRQRKRSFYD